MTKDEILKELQEARGNKEAPDIASACIKAVYESCEDTLVRASAPGDVREEILDLAMDCVLDDRRCRYGELEDNFGRISEFWSTYKGVEFNPSEVAIMMILLKIARQKEDPEYKDNYIDACGYSACAGELAAREANE